jgi:hypothetical protein
MQTTIGMLEVIATNYQHADTEAERKKARHEAYRLIFDTTTDGRGRLAMIAQFENKARAAYVPQPPYVPPQQQTEEAGSL